MSRSIAGAETTATFLAATTYYLLKHPACLRQVQEEIRGKFSSYDEINATAARQLPYLQAVISEGLRIYAPGSGGFPRISTGMKVGDVYVPAGVRHDISFSGVMQVSRDQKQHLS